MTQYNVTGMSCAACQARVEKAVNAVPGVESCAVSLLTNSMGVTGTAKSDEIIKAVVDAGYGASLKRDKASKIAGSSYSETLVDTETPKMKRRLIASLIFLLPLMYVSMGHMMWNWPLPFFLRENHIAMGIYEMLLAGIVMVINQKFFISGSKGLLHKSPNMDTLVAMGAGVSFIYSVSALFSMTSAMVEGDFLSVEAYMDELYFESAAMILTLITVGKMLEANSKGKTTDAIKALMKLAPKTALIIKNGNEVEIPIDELSVGDQFIVKAGDSIPVDGVVLEGTGAVNEASLTGESMPVDKKAGDTISAATVNTSGYMVCQAKRVGEDTSLAQIIQMVSDAAATKAPIAKIADKVSGVFVPVVMGISAITFLVWILLGQELGFALARAISVLVISCPCALGLATPVAIMVGNGVGARNGIMFKTAQSLEQTGKTQIIALDKTGTITMGQPQVTDIVTAEDVAEAELLSIAYALEVKSEHPISKAIVQAALERKIVLVDSSAFEVYAGNGLGGIVGGEQTYAGNLDFMRDSAMVDVNIFEQKASELASQGKTPIYFGYGGRIIGIIAVADKIKSDSAEAIALLKKLGLHVVMLTGDNQIPAAAIARAVGVDEVVSGVKPDGKSAVISKLKEYGNVAMVGDGINDALALTQADTGIAIGAGTDIAIDAAELVLMKSSLMDVVAAIRISRQTIRNIHENLFWAFFYNIIGIPLAAGCYIAAFGWTLNPMFGAAAMSLSSFCVVTNALRLNLIKPYSTQKDKPVKNAITGELIKHKEKEKNKTMEITVKGMMCPHCEAHVKEALEKVAGIESAVADHSKNLVTLTTTIDVAENDIKAAVEGAGYEYLGIN